MLEMINAQQEIFYTYSRQEQNIAKTILFIYFVDKLI